jgi:hypothetical protein
MLKYWRASRLCSALYQWRTKAEFKAHLEIAMTLAINALLIAKLRAGFNRWMEGWMLARKEAAATVACSWLGAVVAKVLSPGWRQWLLIVEDSRLENKMRATFARMSAVKLKPAM